MELYYNDNNRYPASLSDPKMKTYINILPTAPTPADASCTAAQNEFTYARVKDNYSLNFCLGGAFGGYGPGPHTATYDGIK